MMIFGGTAGGAVLDAWPRLGRFGKAFESPGLQLLAYREQRGMMLIRDS